MKTKPILVHPCPFEPPAAEARLQLHAASTELHIRAAEEMAEGMCLEGQSVRIEQLAVILSDEEAIRMRDLFVSEGVLELQDAVDLTSPGGKA